MEFTLYYKGRLKSNGSPAHKQEIRRYFHRQLKILWNQLPLKDRRRLLTNEKKKGDIFIRKNVGDFEFVFIIGDSIKLVAELKITILKPEPPGTIFTQAGDIDNRLKTLLDALKVPNEPNEIPMEDSPKEDEDLFFCLLEDDSLITKITIETDRLLEQTNDKSEVLLLIHVTTKASRPITGNVGLR